MKQPKIKILGSQRMGMNEIPQNIARVIKKLIKLEQEQAEEYRRYG